MSASLSKSFSLVAGLHVSHIHGAAEMAWLLTKTFSVHAVNLETQDDL